MTKAETTVKTTAMVMGEHAVAVALGPCLAMIEFSDIPAGIQALDALAKEAEVTIGSAGTVQCGHYLILFGGQVEPVQFAYDRAVEAGGDAVADKVLLPHAFEGIDVAILNAKMQWPVPGDALAVLQTNSSPTMLKAVDAALKGALVSLVEMRIADGLGGRAIATLWGDLVDVQAAVSIAADVVERGASAQLKASVIARADESVVQAVCGGTRFFKEWRG